MDLETIIADATTVLGLATLAVKIGADAEPFLQTVINLLVHKQSLTDVQRQDLLAKEAALRVELDTDSLPADQA